jgi:signal transduction histidine kinase
MRQGLRTQLTKTIVLIVLITITLISILSNILIKIEFDKYAEKQQENRSEDIVANLSSQYNSLTRRWNTGYVHGVGMYALYEGYVLRLYDHSGALVWDAEDHDMALCKQIMDEITDRMEKIRPGLKGEFVSKDYDLKQNGQNVGKVTITYYGPYFLSESDSQFLNALNLVFIVIGGLSLLSSLIVGGYLAKRISRPIVKTAHIAKQIAEGSYNIRFEGKTKTRELEELITAVNHMADSLNRQENLRKQLTTDVAHELRTPLTAIASHLEAMIDGIWETTPERLKSCYEEIGRISGLVADMESLARMESDILKLKKISFDLLELAHAVSSHFEIESTKKNISLKIQGEPSQIDADRDRINQVIVNLLSNAVKYTPENGHICITVKDTPENSILTVEDNGIGIPKDELPLIFERFYRTDKSRNRKTGGAGIGLTIAKSIVTAHGGKIEVESELDHGSRFIITLPKCLNS